MILMMFSSVQPGRHHLNKTCSVGAAVWAASGGSWPLHLGGVGRFWPGRRANRTQWWAADADLHRWPSQLEFLKKTKITGLKQSLILKQLNSWTRIILTIIFGWGRWKKNIELESGMALFPSYTSFSRYHARLGGSSWLWQQHAASLLGNAKHDPHIVELWGWYRPQTWREIQGGFR